MRLVYTLICVLALYVQPLAGQDGMCGTESTPKYLELITEHRDLIAGHNVLPVRQFRQFATSVHIMRQSDGTGGMMMNEFEQAFAELNVQLSPAGIQLTVCDTIHFIDSDSYYDFSKVQESTLINQYYQDQTINLYFPNSVVTGSGTVLCGYAYFPGWQDVV
ncbi:MAG: hypothetical protein R3330_17315, partial [Saprospiraceae bacterium]|nr:hypothetical protein [Saprospiraceae bacterium]